MKGVPYLKPLQNRITINSRCNYCGYKIPGENTSCFLCEGFNSRADEQKEIFEGTQDLIFSKNLDKAKDSLDKIAAQNVIPEQLYGAANIYGLLSDLKYYDLDYNGPGFMEQNSANVYSSLDLISKSKEMFYKALQLMNPEGILNSNPKLLYLTFISEMRLKRPVDAKRALLALQKSTSDITASYAGMVYSVETKEKGAYQKIESLIHDGNINAIYYLGKHYKNERQIEKARSVLSELTSKVKMPSALFLLHKIESLIEATSL